MHIGIIVYSYTGNTLAVAGQVKAALEQKGHQVTLEKIQAENEDPRTQHTIKLANVPDMRIYDRVIFACPVNGFAPAAVAQAYLSGLPDLAGQAVDVFVTHFFPFAFLGGIPTVQAIQATLARKGAQLGQAGVINWSSRKRESAIKALAERFSTP